jgi:hypothetical protein
VGYDQLQKLLSHSFGDYLARDADLSAEFLEVLFDMLVDGHFDVRKFFVIEVSIFFFQSVISRQFFSLFFPIFFVPDLRQIFFIILFLCDIFFLIASLGNFSFFLTETYLEQTRSDTFVSVGTPLLAIQANRNVFLVYYDPSQLPVEFGHVLRSGFALGTHPVDSKNHWDDIQRTERRPGTGSGEHREPQRAWRSGELPDPQRA